MFERYAISEINLIEESRRKLVCSWNERKR